VPYGNLQLSTILSWINLVTLNHHVDIHLKSTLDVTCFLLRSHTRHVTEPSTTAPPSNRPDSELLGVFSISVRLYISLATPARAVSDSIIALLTSISGFSAASSSPGHFGFHPAKLVWALEPTASLSNSLGRGRFADCWNEGIVLF